MMLSSYLARAAIASGDRWGFGMGEVPGSHESQSALTGTARSPATRSSFTGYLAQKVHEAETPQPLTAKKSAFHTARVLYSLQGM